MHQRVVIRLASVLLAVALVGCDDKLDPYVSDPEFTVTPLAFALELGQSQEVTAMVGGVPAPATWASSNTSIVTVTQTGPASALVTPIAPGNAAVTATLASDSRLRSSSVTVLPSFTIFRQTGISGAGARFDIQEFEIDVPSGLADLTVTLSGGTGDVDLYVFRPGGPSGATLACTGFNAGNTETCSIDDPVGGTWTIWLEQWDPYAGVTLEARGTLP